MDKRPAVEILSEHLDNLIREETNKNSKHYVISPEILASLEKMGQVLGREISLQDVMLGCLISILITQKKQFIRDLESLQSSNFNDPMNLLIEKECRYLEDVIPDGPNFATTFSLASFVYTVLRQKQKLKTAIQSIEFPKIKEAFMQTSVMQCLSDDKVDPNLVSDESLIKFWEYSIKLNRLKSKIDD